jgi:hypothetical protein
MRENDRVVASKPFENAVSAMQIGLEKSED